jgi:hypothetical protein
MRCKTPDIRFYSDLSGLNAGFLSLVADPGLLWHGPVLGLNAAIVSAIRGLTKTENDFIATTPCPLVGIETLPPPNRVADLPPDAEPDDVRWLDSARLFSAELVIYLWQMARRDRLTAALCFGPDSREADRMADMSFGEIQECAAVYRLRARFADHPRFWPDLVRAARVTDPDLQSLTRLTIIPLALTECGATGRQGL